MIYINPEKEGLHPHRHKMSDDDWDRLDRIVQGSDEPCTTEELDAYQDYLYDAIANKLQTHYGSTVLQ